MTFNEWLKANGYDADKLSEKSRKHLELAWKAETAAPSPKPEPENQPSSFDAKVAAVEAESRRISYIREATLRAMESHRGDEPKQKQIRELGAQAEKDKTDTRDFDLALMRIDRAIGPMILTPSSPAAPDDTVLEAAICSTFRLSGLEKRFDERTLDAAHRSFRHGIGLQEMLLLAAERNNGYRGGRRDFPAICKAAFGRNVGAGHLGLDFRADIGPSTISVSGILSNVANKFLASSFLYTEQAWRGIAKIRTANDFKTITTYRLTGANKFEKVPASGELKHGTLGELAYTNKVDTYGKLLGISREDIINDDLSAFMGAADQLGRGAGDSLNEVFWTEWLDDATFFPTDKSLNNYDDGATDSVLSLAGLENADSIFRQQTKPDGTPLGVIPMILLVPTGLRVTGFNLLNSVKIVGQGASAGTVPDGNPFAGAYRLVDSVYLTQTALGGSSTAWYLLADPQNVAAIEVAFLYGRETPTVETGEFDFDRLGLAMRAYMDFGCKKQEYRAAVKLKGAA